MVFLSQYQFLSLNMLSKSQTVGVLGSVRKLDTYGKNRELLAGTGKSSAEYYKLLNVGMNINTWTWYYWQGSERVHGWVMQAALLLWILLENSHAGLVAVFFGVSEKPQLAFVPTSTNRCRTLIFCLIQIKYVRDALIPKLYWFCDFQGDLTDTSATTKFPVRCNGLTC